MASGKNLKEYLGDFSVAALAGVATAVILSAASAFLAWWKWDVVITFLAPIYAWLMGTIEVNRLALLANLMVLAAFSLVALRWYRRSAAVVSEVAPVVTPPGTAQALSLFEPEKFELTPPRCRALLALLHRVDSKTTLHDLHTRVMNNVSTAGVKPISKGELQRDMEEAEHLGVVSIERVGTLTQYYNLTMPKGRDWVVINEDALRTEAVKGLIRR